ncbi:BatD family protein, partial [Candidatus Omnitrophota bacterium]
LCLLLICFSPVFAEDISFEVTIDRTRVALGSSLQLSLNFYNTQNISAPDLPDIDGFDWRYLGPSTRISIVNSKVSSSITHMYTLIPLKVGTFTIPSLSAEYEGQTYTSSPITIEVTQGTVGLPQGSQESGSTGSMQGLEDRVFLIMQVDKKKAYVNEITPVTIKLYINRLTIRDIQFPELLYEGFSVDTFDQPKQYREALGGVVYDVIEFNTNIFATRPGELRLGPATLQCNLLIKKTSRKRSRSPFFDDDFFGSGIFDGFFDRYENYPLNLKSIDIPFEIMALPQEGKPDNFSGTLGSYNFDLQVSPREVKVGDPITLKMIISGEGNFKTINSLSLNFSDAFKVYEPEIEQNQANKTFEQIIIPKSEEITEIPEISFSFFDTNSGTYKTLTKGPIPIEVIPLPEGEELKVYEPSRESTGMFRKKEVLGKDIIYIKNSPGRLKRKGEFLFKKSWFVLIQLLPLVAIMLVFIYQRRKERLQTDIRYARSLRAPRKVRKNIQKVKRLLRLSQADQFFDAVFNTLQEYLGDKFHLPTAGITSDIVNNLAPYNVSQETIDKLRECFGNCDTARFAKSSITKDQMQRTLTLLEDAIDKLERLKI